MRLHLVSLALLLLALCRSSTASVFSSTTTTTDTKTTITAAEKTAEMAKIAPPNLAAKKAEVDGFLGNTLYAMILDGIKKPGETDSMFDKLPPFYKKALTNGVLCEMEDQKIGEKIVNNLYGVTDGKMTARDRKIEDDLFKTEMNCGGSPVDPTAICWCAGTAAALDYKSILFCRADAFAKKIGKDFTRAPLCLEGKDGALAELKKVAPTYGADDLKDEDKSRTQASGETSGVPTSENDAKIYCEASSANVEEAIKNVYAADATLWTVDGIISFGLSEVLKKYGMTKPEEADVSCADDKFKSSPVGKCVCDLDKGILLFCYPHLMGNKLQEIGYLKCDGTARFEGTAPTALPDINEPSKDVTKSPNATDTTTAGPNSAATSSLLLAAAVVLLGQ